MIGHYLRHRIARGILRIAFALIRPLGFEPGGYFDDRSGACAACVVRLRSLDPNEKETP